MSRRSVMANRRWPTSSPGSVDALHEIRENAVDAGCRRMQLLMPVAREQHRQGCSGKLHRLEPLGRAHVGEVQVQPEPAATVAFDRLTGRERFRRAVLANSKCPDE